MDDSTQNEQTKKDIQEMVNKTKLDNIKDRLEKAQQSVKSKPALIEFPYHGSRSGYFVYHPKRFPGDASAHYDAVKKLFNELYKSWLDVVELYQDDMPLSEPIVKEQLKKDVKKILEDIDKRYDPRLLEALAEVLWQKEGAIQDQVTGKFSGPSEKSTQHDLTMFQELERRAEEIKHEDLGVIVAGPQILRPIKHGWGG